MLNDNNHEPAGIDTPTIEDHPADKVTVPLSSREVARVHALAGVALGMSAVLSVMTTVWTPTGGTD